jgi:hypothetical protein
MSWIRDPAWQQGLAIVLVVLGAILIYRGTATAGELGTVALLGVTLFAIGVALPLISPAFRAHRANAAKSEDV